MSDRFFEEMSREEQKKYLEWMQKEIDALKELAQDKIRSDEIFKFDEKGNPIERGNYSDYVKAMKGAGINPNRKVKK